MPNAIDIQDRIFEKIKHLLPEDTSFVDELALQLNISFEAYFNHKWFNSPMLASETKLFTE